jgi:hypothetical protein
MRNVLIVAAALLILAPSSRAQFEGLVRMVAVSQPEGDSTVVRSTVYFKGKLLAAEVEPDESGGEQGAKFILRGDRNVMWIVIEEEGKVIEIPIGDSSKGPGARTPAGRNPIEHSYTLSSTGKTMKLAGFTCQEWVADEGEGKTARIWATTDLGNMYGGVVQWFDEMSVESATAGDRWERELADRNLFPLRIIRSEEGVVTETEEVVSVEKRKVPASIFEVPEGFEKQKVDLNFEKMFEEMMKNMETDSAGGGN